MSNELAMVKRAAGQLAKRVCGNRNRGKPTGEEPAWWVALSAAELFGQTFHSRWGNFAFHADFATMSAELVSQLGEEMSPLGHTDHLQMIVRDADLSVWLVDHELIGEGHAGFRECSSSLARFLDGLSLPTYALFEKDGQHKRVRAKRMTERFLRKCRSLLADDWFLHDSPRHVRNALRDSSDEVPEEGPAAIDGLEGVEVGTNPYEHRPKK